MNFDLQTLDKAVSTLYRNGSQNQEQRDQAMNYLNSFTNSPNGWRLSLDFFFQPIHAELKFYFLTVFQDLVQYRFMSLSVDERKFFYSRLLVWIPLYDSQLEGRLIAKKYSQVMALVFNSEYLDSWTTFFHDLFGILDRCLVDQREKVIEILLRIFEAIDETVINSEFNRSPQDAAHATAIKDAMRVESVAKMAKFWFDILGNYNASNALLCQLSLLNIQKYVGWIDINLIANQFFLPLIFHLINNKDLKTDACGVLEQVISKGMLSESKLQLLSQLRLQDLIAQANQGNVSEEDEFQRALAKLTNVLGVEAITCRTDCVRGRAAPEILATADVIVQDAVTLGLKFLGSEWDDLSESVLQFLGSYLHHIKHTKNGNEKTVENMKQLLQIIRFKLQYTEEYNFEQPGDEEALFERFRKDLQSLLRTIHLIIPEITRDFVRESVLYVVQNAATAKASEIEASLVLYFAIGEGQTEPNLKSEYFRELTGALIQSSIGDHAHSAVSTIYFETISRFTKSIPLQEPLIVKLLGQILGNRGIRNPAPHVRSRVSYFFSRVARDLGPIVCNYAKDILESITPLLNLELDQEVQVLSDTTQEPLYEAAGYLLYMLGDEGVQKVRLQAFATNHINKMQLILQNKLYLQDSVENQAVYSNFLIRSIYCIACFSKGFQKPNATTRDFFLSFLNLVSLCVHTIPSNNELRERLILILHRLVDFIDAEVLNFLRDPIELILLSKSPITMAAFIRLCNQLMSRLGARSQPVIDSILVPFIIKIFEILDSRSESFDASDYEELYRHYFLLLQSILNTKVTAVFISEANRPFLNNILQTILTGCLGVNVKIKTVKLCFQLLEGLCSEWIGGLPGFEEFVEGELSAVLFTIGFSSQFNVDDAECFQVLQAIASLEKKIFDKNQALCERTVAKALSKLSIAPSVAADFYRTIHTDSGPSKSSAILLRQLIISVTRPNGSSSSSSSSSSSLSLPNPKA